MFGDNYRKIAGWKEKSLITEQARDSGHRHRTTMPTKLRKGLSLRNAIGVPCHRFLPSHGADKDTCHPVRQLFCYSYSNERFGQTIHFLRFRLPPLRDKRTVPKPKRILSRLNDDWQEFYLKKCTKSEAPTSTHAFVLLRSTCFLPVKRTSAKGPGPPALTTQIMEPVSNTRVSSNFIFRSGIQNE
jgi:hypothetical protein